MLMLEEAGQLKAETVPHRTEPVSARAACTGPQLGSAVHRDSTTGAQPAAALFFAVWFSFCLLLVALFPPLKS